jgi:3-hydroxyisobutyrate dehydrogenase-like beta-hydroxyacid dehydrogenase
MHIAIVGATAMIGRKLTARFVADGQLAGHAVSRLSLVDVVTPLGGFAKSRILDIHGQRMVDRDFGTAGPSRLQLKDLNNRIATAQSLWLTLPLTQAVRAAFAKFVDHDHSGLLLQLEEKFHRSSKG